MTAHTILAKLKWGLAFIMQSKKKKDKAEPTSCNWAPRPAGKDKPGSWTA